MDRGTDGKESPKVTRREKEDPSTGMRNWTISLSRWKRIGTGDMCVAVLVIFFDMEEIVEEYASAWNAVCFFESVLRSDLLPVSHHWSMVWRETGREREREREN